MKPPGYRASFRYGAGGVNVHPGPHRDGGGVLRGERPRLHPGVVVQIDPFEKHILKPVFLTSIGSRVGSPGAFELWINWIRNVYRPTMSACQAMPAGTAHTAGATVLPGGGAATLHPFSPEDAPSRSPPSSSAYPSAASSSAAMSFAPFPAAAALLLPPPFAAPPPIPPPPPPLLPPSLPPPTPQRSNTRGGSTYTST